MNPVESGMPSDPSASSRNWTGESMPAPRGPGEKMRSVFCFLRSRRNNSCVFTRTRSLPMSRLKFPITATALVLLALADFSRAATPLPLWYGQPGTTRQGYLYTGGSLTPAANPLENAYGTVSSQITLGSFSDGWQDPNDPIDLTGVDADGAWDLGRSGKIAIAAPAAPSDAAPGFYYRVDFQVYAVGYRGISALPSFSMDSIVPQNLSMSSATVANDPLFPGASWDSRTWTGEFYTTSAAPVVFNITAPANNTSVVDTVEVFTRFTLIPEPGTALLAGLSAVFCFLRRKR